MKKLLPIICVPILIFLMLLILTQSASAAEIPKINSYVTDNANVISSNAKSQLEKELRDLERLTNGVQFAVYIENEYPKEYSLEEYALKIAELNKIGKKGNDNGILLYVAVKDRKYRWEVGYGVESTLSSPLLGRISREYLIPNFKENNYEKGILQSTDMVRRLLLKSDDADIIALKNYDAKKSGNVLIIPAVIFFIIFIIGIMHFLALTNSGKSFKGKRHRDSVYHGAAFGLFTGGFGRGGFGNSGGFGGFSGGGGNFGGGGSSGGW